MFPCHASNAFPSKEHLTGMPHAEYTGNVPTVHDYNMFVGLHMCTAESYRPSHMGRVV